MNHKYEPLMVHKEAFIKSLTIHALDDHLAAQVKRRADELSISMNELVKGILAESLGIKAPSAPPHHNDFKSFCGTWTAKEAKAFQTGIADTEKLNPEDWK